MGAGLCGNPDVRSGVCLTCKQQAKRRIHRETLRVLEGED